MDVSQVKKCLVRWVDIEKQLRELDLQRKVFNKDIKEKKTILLEKQKEIKDPILQMMNNIDTETIDINDELNVKSSQICKTTGVTKKYMQTRIIEYFSGNSSTYKTLISQFARRFNFEISDTDVSDYVNEFAENEASRIFDYITDITPRKVFYDEEKLTLCKRRKIKNKA
jgi:hypothetical protein